MAKMKIDAVTVTSTNFAKTVRFYTLLGFTFPKIKASAKHIGAITPTDEVHLMIDDAGLMKDITGKTPVPPSHSSFAIKCDFAADVDAAVTSIRKASLA